MAATITSTGAGGAWAAGTTWVGGIAPATTDIVVIALGATVTTGGNQTCAGITITGTLSMAANNVLTVNGDVSGTGTWTAADNTRNITLTGNWSLNAAASSSGTATFTGTNIQTLTGRLSSVNNTATLVINKPLGGSVTIGNAINVSAFTNTAGTFDPSTFLITATTRTFTAGTLRVGAATWAANYSGAIVQPAAGTIEYDALGAQTVNDIAYTGNLTISGSGTKTWTEGAARIVTGNLTVGDGTTLNVAGAFAFTVTGTTTIGGGTSGILSITNATGIKTFTGAVTINAGGAITETAAAQLAFGSDVTITGTLTENGAAVVGIAGNLTNNGTYTASTGVHTFSGATKTVGGTTANVIPSATFTGNYSNNGTLTCATAITVTGAAVVLTNNATITAAATLTGTGTLSNAATGTLALSGTCSVATLTNNGIVNRSGAGTTTSTTVTNNLTFNMSGTGTVTAFTNTANGVLNLSNTTVPTITTLTVSASGNTVNYTAAGAQTIIDVAYSNLTTSGSGIKTWTEGAARNMTGNLTVGDGTTLSVAGAFAFTVTGTTIIGSGTSGTLSITNATGTKTFTGAVTISAGGALTETASAQLAFGSDVTINGALTENGAAVVGIAGNFTNNGTYTASSGNHTFSGANKTIGGTGAGTGNATTIPTATFTGAYSNNSSYLSITTSLTVTGAGVILTNNTTIGLVNISGTGGLTQGTNAILSLGGTSTIATLTATASGNTVNYFNGNQTVYQTNYFNLTLSGAGTKTLQPGTTTISGNLTLSSTATTTTVVGLTIGGNLIVGDGTTFTANATYALTVTGTTTIGGGTSGTLAISTAATNTQTFTGSVTINNGANLTESVAATMSFGSDIVDNGTLSFGSGILNISGNLSGAGNVTGGTGSINISGNWTQSGTFTANTSTVNYNGSSANQTVQGAITYYNLQLSNGSTKLLQVGNATVSNVLTLTSCTITTNAYSIIVSSTGTVSRTSGYVIGNLNLYFATGATSHTFDIGDGSAYTPVTVSFASVTTAGTLTASTTTGDHPQISSSGLNSSKTANRYWTLTNGGIVFTTYSVVFTFVPADLDASAVPASFSVGRYNGGTWSTPTIGTRTSTTTQATGIAAFGDFQLGNIQISGVINYTVTRQTGITYNSIAATGNAVESWRTTNISDNSYYDDNRSNPVPIGFDFWYDGSRYTQFSVSTNGYIDFDASNWNGGSGAIQQYNPYGPYSTDFVDPTRSAPAGAAGTVTALAPFYFDLTTWQTTVPLGNSIKYQLSGTAPTRVLTIEWINMSCWVHTEDVLYFQVKLYESTGVIEYNYGTMSGTIELEAGFGYVTGINAPSISPNPPTAAQLLCLQTANTNTFSNTQQYQLLTMPQSNSKYTFTPNIPATPTSLNFSNVTSSSMRLTWLDNADNELGYTIYRSDNGGATYTFIRQLAAGSTYSDEPGLTANNTYYWKVYAFTEGGLSSALSGSYATPPAVGFISAQTGNWNTGATWVGGVVPTPNADVTIANGHVVTLDVNASLNSLTVGQGAGGTLHIGNNVTARTLTISGGLIINNGATLDVNTAFAQTGHAITLSGNLINNGVLNLGPNASSAAGIIFNKTSGTQTISGTGTTTNFYSMNVNVGTTSSDILEVTTSNFSSLSAGFLTLTNGTFKVSTGATITPFSVSQTIPSTAGLWINNSSAVVSTTGGDLSVVGILRITTGTLNIGNAADNRLIYSGGTITIEGGAVNVAGRIERSNLTTIINFNMSGGVLTVPTVGSTSTTVSPFELTVIGSTFTWSNGSIIIQREGGSGAQDLGYVNTLTSFTVTGGTLQIGNPATPAAQTMNINSSPSIYNILVNNTNATAVLVGNITILGNMTVTSGALETTLNGLANFNGTVAQNITSISPITFNNLTLNNSTGLSVSNSITVTCTLTLTNGVLSIGGNTLTFQTSDNPIARTSGTITTTTSSSLVFGTSGNTGGASFTIPASTFTAAPSITNFTINRTNNLTLNNQMMSLSGILLCNGPLATNGNLTLLSTAAQTALIDGSGSGQVSGNVIMQRYLPSGFGYKYVSSPFQAATVNEFSNDLDLAASFPTFYKYDENRNSAGWVSYITTTNPLNPLQGYAANFGSAAIAKTVDATGVVNNGILANTLYNHNQPYTLGFNLVGNPYPSPINWDAASGWTKTNIDNALYYFKAGITDQYTGTYSTYINGISSDGLATNIIPSMQGFFVHVSNGTYPVTGTLGITNSVRTNDLTHALIKSMRTDTLPLLRITAGFTDNGTPSDPAVIYFDSSATQLFDKNLDALKLMNTDILVPNVYTLTPDSQRLSISAIPLPVDSIKSIPLGIKAAKDGWITFKASDIVQMPAERYIYLVDSVAGVNQDLKLNPQYRFFLKAGEYENRFSLVFSLTVLNNIPKEFSLLQNYPNPFNPRTTIKYSIPQTSFVSITVYDILGREVSKLVNEEKLSGSYEVQFDGSKLSSGVYFYRLHAGDYFKTKKLMLLK